MWYVISMLNDTVIGVFESHHEAERCRREHDTPAMVEWRDQEEE